MFAKLYVPLTFTFKHKKMEHSEMLIGTLAKHPENFFVCLFLGNC